MSRFFSPHIDVVSVGALTHGYGVPDFSLKIMKGEAAAAMIAATEAALRRSAAAASAAPAAAGGAGARE